MFDPDPLRPILRLGAEPEAKPLTTTERLALAERDMEAAVARWSEAFTAWQSERAQAQPIPAAQPVKQFHRLFDGFIKPTGDGAVRYERPKVFRADGTVDYLDGFQALDAPL